MPKLKINPLDAKRLLGDINPAWKAFWFHNGPVVRSLSQLAAVLPKVSPEMFGHHVNSAKNDIASWVKDAVGDAQLAADLLKAKDQLAAAELIETRIKELQASMAVTPKAKK